MKLNFDAEQAVIGDILLDAAKVMPLAAKNLDGDEFYTPEFRAVYAACLELWREKSPIDAVTVLARTGQQYRNIILTAAQAVPTVSHAENYIQAVKETHQKIRASEKAQELLEAIETEPLDSCREISREISKLLLGESKINTTDAKAGFLDFVERADKPRNYIKTGLWRLDKNAHISHGDYIIIGGKPSSGKTALTLQMMLNMAKTERVIYFSLETSKEKIIDRLICHYAKAPIGEIKENRIADWDSVMASYDTFKNLDFEIVEAAGWSVGQVEAYAIQREAKIIFIDYLSILRSPGKSLYERVTNISMDLRTMAQRNKTAVFALSQLRRNDNKEPSLEDLRESGQIEQDADCVMLLHIKNPEEQCSDRELILSKNKEGVTGKMTLTFQGHYQTFYQQEDDRYGR